MCDHESKRIEIREIRANPRTKFQQAAKEQVLQP